MQRKIAKLALGAMLAGMSLGFSPAAYAFLPAGGFDSFDTLRFRRFPLAEFDTNGDGSVGPGEGLELFVESGPRGFSTSELLDVRAGLQVWEDVPTSYVAFGNIRESEDIFNGTAEPDFLNTISLQVGPDDVVEEGQEPDTVDDVTEDLVGITFTTYTLDETVIPIRGQTVIIPAGTIIDADITINAGVHRSLTPSDALVELEATTAALTGLFLGLGLNPLNNLRELNIAGVDEPLGVIESEVLGLTGADGEQRRIGATPTMFPAYFQVDDFETNRFIGGWADLAPDDISAISWLYPQGSQANFFSLEQEARTQTRPGSNLPSSPISGGHVVAWADADNDPTTPRVPLFNTMTGLYINPKDEGLWGRFEMIGIWKQLEIPGTAGVLFNPSYTISLNPFNGTGLERQALGDFFVGSTPDFFDSISGETGLGTTVGGAGGTKEYDTSFPSEVYQEIQNISDVSNKDAGTPLLWDFARNQFISQDSGKTIAQLIPAGRPMFGDANDVCPLNIISGTGTDTGTDTGGLTGATIAGGAGGAGTGGLMARGSNLLRSFRDNILLNNSIGTAMVHAYYQSAPTMAKALLHYSEAIAPLRQAISAIYWVLLNGPLAVALLAGTVLGGLAFRRYRRAAATLLLLLAVSLAGVASAQVRYVTNKSMVGKSTLIVKGVVITESARWAAGGRIYTDLSLEVTDVVKSPPPPVEEGEEEAEAKAEGEEETPPPFVADGDIVNYSVVGGQIGTIRQVASPIPTFDEGDSVVLYFVWKNEKWVVLNGERGKVDVVTEAGKEYVTSGSAIAELGLLEVKNKPVSDATESAGPEGGTKIEAADYLDYLRGLAANE